MFTSIEPFVAGNITLLAFILFTNPKPVNRLGNRWLAVFLCLVAIMIFDKGLYENKFYQTHAELVGITDMILFFLAPIFYLTVEYFVTVNKKFDKKDFLHFVIPILSLPFSIQFILQSPEFKQQQLGSLTSLLSGVSPFLVIQIVIYWFLAHKRLQKHQRVIQLFASSTDKIDLNWLNGLFVGVAGFIAIFIADSYFNTYWIVQYTSFGYLIFVYFLAYFAFQQSEIFPFETQDRDEIKEIIEEVVEHNAPVQKHERLSETQIAALKKDLTELMQNEKTYLEEDLTLPKLAQKMAVSTHELSYLLNEGFGVSFFQFVNNYRVEETKRLLASAEHDHLNMVGIAYAAGFSSRTTFYTTFKKMTNQSPSEFQNALRKRG
jgi:AraC-like DNA-binding protein